MKVKKVIHPKFIFLLTVLFCLGLLAPASALGTSTELKMQEVYPAGETIVVEYTGSLEQSWLGVYPAGELQKRACFKRSSFLKQRMGKVWQRSAPCGGRVSAGVLSRAVVADGSGKLRGH